jgi:glycine oxidase
MKNLDYIIVGQGIAGSILSLELLKKSKKILIINDEKYSASSRVAAGIWNPIVFKRLTKSWLADDVIPVLENFYEETELLLNKKFIKYIPIAKVFSEEQEKKLWLNKANNELKFYLNDTIHELSHPLNLNYSTVKKTGNLDTKLFLSELSNYFKNHNCLLNEKFNFNDLALNSNKISYKEYSAEKIIFCEGYKIINNPFFNWIPMKPAKGDVITIHCESLNINMIINKGVFVLPLGKNLFKIGATYNWKDLHDEPDENAKYELIEKFKKIIPFEFEILNHESGVRPAVIDRRPVIGFHPENKNLSVFNGFGTKAVMLSPFFAKQFCKVLISNQAIHPEINVSRFYKKKL